MFRFSYYIYNMIQQITRKQVEAQYLKKGDVLCSGGTVTHAPTVGLKTPKGNVDLGVDGMLKTWNKKTKIAVVDQR